MGCNHKSDSACPFAMTEESEVIQNYGCLPTSMDIMTMRVVHGKTWACHEQTDKPCIGAIQRLREEGLPHKVVDRDLITEKNNWEQYCNEESHLKMKILVPIFPSQVFELHEN